MLKTSFGSSVRGDRPSSVATASTCESEAVPAIEVDGQLELSLHPVGPVDAREAAGLKDRALIGQERVLARAGGGAGLRLAGLGCVAEGAYVDPIPPLGNGSKTTGLFGSPASMHGLVALSFTHLPVTGFQRPNCDLRWNIELVQIGEQRVGVDIALGPR